MSNTVEILKLLDKSNCKKSSEPTCLAFAVVVATGRRALNECVSIEEDVIEQFGSEAQDRSSPDTAADILDVYSYGQWRS